MVHKREFKSVGYAYFNVLPGIYGGQQVYGKQIFVLAAYVPALAVAHFFYRHRTVTGARIVRLGGVAGRNGGKLCAFAEGVAVKVEFKVADFVVCIVEIREIHGAFDCACFPVEYGEYVIFA